MQNENNRLIELGGSKYEIVDGEPDIRNWDVEAGNGATIGEVDDLLFDLESGRVRYIIVDLDNHYSGTKKDRKVLIPIGLATLHKDNDKVLLPNITREQFAALPDYIKGDFDAGREKMIRNIFETPVSADLATPISGINDNSHFYDHEHFDENRLYESRNKETDQTIPVLKEQVSFGKRIVETGGVAIHTNIVEERVEENVELRQEHVTVERQPVDKSLTGADFAPFQESVIEFKEYAEVPVVSKEARVVEEISLTKDVRDVNEVVRDTVRETQVDVDSLKAPSR